MASHNDITGDALISKRNNDKEQRAQESIRKIGPIRILPAPVLKQESAKPGDDGRGHGRSTHGRVGPVGGA